MADSILKDIARVSPNEVHPRVHSGSSLLVCAYDNQEKFEKNHLQGAISLDVLKLKASTLPKDQELVFYCA